MKILLAVVTLVICVSNIDISNALKFDRPSGGKVTLGINDPARCVFPKSYGCKRGLRRTRFYYDPTTDSCNSFTYYGRCPRSPNNFIIARTCSRTCVGKDITARTEELLIAPTALETHEDSKYNM